MFEEGGRVVALVAALAAGLDEVRVKCLRRGAGWWRWWLHLLLAWMICA